MVGTECFLVDRQRSLVERFGIGVATLARIEESQIVERCRDIGMVRSERFFPDRRRSLC
jgi:hypothetical protein